MEIALRQTKRVLAGLAFWTILVGGTVAQDSGRVPLTNGGVPEGCWPPPCNASSCDPCAATRSLCPENNDIFLCPPRPRVYGVFDGGALRRNPTHAVNFASIDDPGHIGLSTDNFNYDFSAMGRALVGVTINECLQVEGSYMAVAEAADTAAIRGPNNLYSPFGGFGANPIVGVDDNNFAQIHYASSLRGGELNVRRQVPVPPGRLTMSVLVGVRYVGLPEEFDYNTESLVANNSIHVTTNNQMIGPQIGALFNLYVDNRWWTVFEMKGALLNNQAAQTTSGNVYFNGAATPFSSSVQENHTAFAGDLALTAVYRWSPHLATRLGYQALWLTNMALAPSNFNTDINMLVQGPAQLNHGSQTVYHGPFVGVEVGW